MSKPINTGGYVYPLAAATGDPRDGVYCQHGITLRAHIATQIMAGLVANPGGPIQANGMTGWGYANCIPIQVAGHAVELADALIAALEKEGA